MKRFVQILLGLAALGAAESARAMPLGLRTGLWSRELFDPTVPTVPPLDENWMILEVKYNQFLPPYIRDLLNTYCAGACPSAISKYTWCRRFEELEA